VQLQEVAELAVIFLSVISLNSYHNWQMYLQDAQEAFQSHHKFLSCSLSLCDPDTSLLAHGLDIGVGRALGSVPMKSNLKEKLLL
jgi:fructose-specific component phosphotransferase system IIB-like protein